MNPKLKWESNFIESDSIANGQRMQYDVAVAQLTGPFGPLLEAVGTSDHLELFGEIFDERCHLEPVLLFLSTRTPQDQSKLWGLHTFEILRKGWGTPPMLYTFFRMRVYSLMHLWTLVNWYSKL